MDPTTLNILLDWSEDFALYLAKGTAPVDSTSQCPALGRLAHEVVSSPSSLQQVLARYTDGHLSHASQPLWLDMSHVPQRDYAPMLGVLNTGRGSSTVGKGNPVLLQVPEDAINLIREDYADLWSMHQGAVVDFSGWKKQPPEL